MKRRLHLLDHARPRGGIEALEGGAHERRELRTDHASPELGPAAAELGQRALRLRHALERARQCTHHTREIFRARFAPGARHVVANALAPDRDQLVLESFECAPKARLPAVAFGGLAATRDRQRAFESDQPGELVDQTLGDRRGIRVVGERGLKSGPSRWKAEQHAIVQELERLPAQPVRHGTPSGVGLLQSLRQRRETLDRSARRERVGIGRIEAAEQQPLCQVPNGFGHLLVSVRIDGLGALSQLADQRQELLDRAPSQLRRLRRALGCDDAARSRAGRRRGEMIGARRQLLEAALEVVLREGNITIELDDEIPWLVSANGIACVEGLDDAPAGQSISSVQSNPTELRIPLAKISRSVRKIESWRRSRGSDSCSASAPICSSVGPADTRLSRKRCRSRRPAHKGRERSPVAQS